ncbi:MAG: hypothetical protein CMB77_01790 [Euryarchaeota archaeon]|nr:hypothetical protein [Euryarchaeota archaeon]
MADEEGRLSEVGELRHRLQSMELKLKRLRDLRDQHNDSAKRAADQRDMVQEAYKELKQRIDEGVEKRTAIRDEINEHRSRRDLLNEQAEELRARSRGKKGSKRTGMSATAEYNDLRAKIQQIGAEVETAGTLTLEKEKNAIDRMRRMKQRVAELEPLVSEHSKLEVDLDDIEAAITDVRSASDDAHSSMIEAIKRIELLNEELDGLFDQRNFLKAEGDRHHAGFVAQREKATEVHERVTALLDEVNDVRAEMKKARDEARSWIDDHNQRVREEMADASESSEVHDEIVKRIMNEGGLELGKGSGGGQDRSPAQNSDSAQPKRPPRIQPMRRRRGA